MSEARERGRREAAAGGDAAGDGDEEVGSVADEAGKLFGALSDWARNHGTDLGHGLSGFATHAATSARDIDEHIATGGAECTICPICRTVHAIRQTSPEVRAHLGVAAASLMQAAAGILATAVPDEHASGSAHSDGIEHIDLDDDPEEDA